jgi:hypothetical protein
MKSETQAPLNFMKWEKLTLLVGSSLTLMLYAQRSIMNLFNQRPDPDGLFTFDLARRVGINSVLNK